MKKILFACIIGLFCISFLNAAIKSDEIIEAMQKKIDFTTYLLQKNDKNKAVVAPMIFEAFDSIFDYELMAKLSLGSKQLKKLSQKEKEIFYKEFEERLKSSYVDKLSLYTDEKVKIKELKDVKNRKILLTELIGKEKSFQIDYKFYDAKERGWLIYDVDILGVSIIQTYRSQFARILDGDSFEKLIELLKSTQISE